MWTTTDPHGGGSVRRLADVTDSAIDAVGVLHEPLRRAVYERAVADGRPVSRNEIADALGIGRTLAAHHLDRLADAGLLAVSFARVSGRTGPGAGRPAKLYERSRVEHALSLPPRQYRLLAEVLADAVEDAGVEPALYRVARKRGAAQPDGVAALERLGFEPWTDGDVVRLRNCPFDGVAHSNPGVACGASLAFVQGLCGDDTSARLDPRPEGCCVVLDAGSKNNMD